MKKQRANIRHLRVLRRKHPLSHSDSDVKIHSDSMSGTKRCGVIDTCRLKGMDRGQRLLLNLRLLLLIFQNQRKSTKRFRMPGSVDIRRLLMLKKRKKKERKNSRGEMMLSYSTNSTKVMRSSDSQNNLNIKTATMDWVRWLLIDSSN